MDVFKNRYYNTNRLMLSLAGLWPYENLYRRTINVTVLFFILCTSMFMLMLKMARTGTTMAFVTFWLQFAVPIVLFGTNLVYSFIQADKMKMLLEHIKCDWSLFQQRDTEVIEPYAEIARTCTLGLTALSVVLPTIPLFLSTKRSSSNDTDILELFVPIDVSTISQTDYLLYLLFAATPAFFLGFLITLAVGTLYLCSVQHACGIFSIAGKRMETMFDDIEVTVCKGKDKLRVFQSIMFHTRAIGFINIVNSFYGPLYLTKMSLLIVLLSVDILQVTESYNSIQDSDKIIMSIGHLLFVLLVIAIFCYSGQILIDHSNDICRKIYSSQWYHAPLNVQKLVMIVMIRGFRESGITMTKSITASFEMFAAMLQLSVSYFMAISSLQSEC